jgi:hypothetical protein
MKLAAHCRARVRDDARCPRSALGATLLAASLLATGCAAPSWRHVPHDRLFQRTAPAELHAEPKELDPSDWWGSFYYGSLAQLGALVSPGRYAQEAFAYERALDVNAFGQVPDSTWFENRHARRRMSPGAIYRGPCTSEGPAPGKLAVKSGKTEGVTPGLIVEDSAGQGWVVKFDPPAYPELNSGAEVISTNLLHAAGYHVPENYVVRFRLDRLESSPKATTKDRYGRKVPFTPALLAATLSHLIPESDGRVRAMFSKYLPGKPVGPFPLRGVRLDDPNDRIPHERRRSLRGLWVLYAWLNNTDAKEPNGLDIFVKPEGAPPELGYVKHFLIDFGTSLGASPHGPKAMIDGHEYLIDWQHVLGRLFTLGIEYPYWVTAKPTPLRSVGQFESEVFDPARWHPLYPNVPFERADALDTFWAASILAHFDARSVAAAVAAGEYTDPAASAFVTYTLLERRDKILRYAFRDLAPLDQPRIEGGRTLVLVDLELAAGLEPPARSRYPWRLVWHGDDGDVVVAKGVAPRPRIELDALRRAFAPRFGTDTGAPFYTLEMGRAKPPGRPTKPRVDVHLRLLSPDRWIAVGMERVKK